jgi:hypothetical protein
MLQMFIPWLGYLASVCLILALLVRNQLQFRWYSAGGNVFFILYGAFLSAYPVLITNGILLSINAYHLYKVYRKQEYFDLMEFKGEEKLAQKFLSFYAVDIRKYFPAFEPACLEGNLNFVVTRDLVIANMFSARIEPNGDAYIQINYTLEKYRDYKVGTYIFEKERDFLVSKGIKRLVYHPLPGKPHLPFLLRMGFREKRDEGQISMVKDLGH